MEQSLKDKLLDYLIDNHPDFLVNLQEGQSLAIYLQDKILKMEPRIRELIRQGKPSPVAEKMVMTEFTADLGPSKFQFIRRVLEEDFPVEYQEFIQRGVLTYEVVNLMAHCRDTFETFEFSESIVDDSRLRHAIISDIHGYLP